MAKRTFTTPACTSCHKTSEVELESEDVKRWQGGELIQNVWPDISAEDRELLMTGIHSICWNTMFGEAAEEAVAFIDFLIEGD